MGDAEGMIEEAVKYDGYLETPGNWTKFGKAFGWDGVSWCHIYLSVCAKWSGNGDVIPWTASCWSGVQWFKKRGQFFRRGEKTPKPGDIVYYGSAGQDHVGLVVSVSGGKIHTIEGNTSKASGFNPNGGGVHRKEWSLSYSRIYGYGRPAYSNTVSMEEDPLIGLKKGDKGQAVKALQELCRAAGQGATIDKHGGTDGQYGDGTAEALRLVRKSVGSRAGKGFGDKVDGWAYSQLMVAVARKQGGK